VIALWKLPLTLDDGTKVHEILSVNLRPLVTLEDGTRAEGENSPDDFPPVGGGVYTLDDGSTVTVPYERAYYSMDLTTLARVKTQLGGISGTTADALLATIITSVSARMEGYMRRNVLKQTYTKTYPIPRLDTVLRLEAYPVESITYVRYGAHPADLDTADRNLDARAYVLEDDLGGLVRFAIPTPLNNSRRPGYAKVQFVGGMAEDIADFILLFPELAQQASIQCAYEYQRRRHPVGDVQTEGGSTSFGGEMGWAASVRETMDRYRRLMS
jgi:uncharacterized phiE125 gp8 family phage protein